MAWGDPKTNLFCRLTANRVPNCSEPLFASPNEFYDCCDLSIYAYKSGGFAIVRGSFSPYIVRLADRPLAVANPCRLPL